MSAVSRLKIVLKDVEPIVMRRVEVPLSIKFDRLHTVIQTVMGCIFGSSGSLARPRSASRRRAMIPT